MVGTGMSAHMQKCEESGCQVQCATMMSTNAANMLDWMQVGLPQQTAPLKPCPAGRPLLE